MINPVSKFDEVNGKLSGMNEVKLNEKSELKESLLPEKFEDDRVDTGILTSNKEEKLPAVTASTSGSYSYTVSSTAKEQEVIS